MIDDDDIDESNIGTPSTEWMIESMKNNPIFAEFVKGNLAKNPFFDLQWEGLRDIMNKDKK